MCGTCKFCLGFFQLGATLSTTLMISVKTLHILYGAMPPVTSFQIGGWMTFITGWTSLYITLYIVRVLGKGVFTKWTPKYCLVVLVLLVLAHLIMGIIFSIPVTEEKIMEYTKSHLAVFHRVPDFLNTFQEKQECCGVHNYRDYLTELSISNQEIRRTVVQITEDDPLYYKVKKLQNLSPVPINASKTITEYVFDVPRSCCSIYGIATVRDCGNNIVYNPFDEGVVTSNILTRLNNVSVGCYEKYHASSSNPNVQLHWLVHWLRYGSYFQCLNYMFLIWLYQLSLKSMRRNLRTQLLQMHSEDDIPEHLRRELIHLHTEEEPIVEVTPVANNNESEGVAPVPSASIIKTQNQKSVPQIIVHP